MGYELRKHHLELALGSAKETLKLVNYMHDTDEKVNHLLSEITTLHEQESSLCINTELEQVAKFVIDELKNIKFGEWG
ncbi:MAG: hypothetical protein QNK36_15105 [Colwellia sp.]|nr:hypothetical protein [Colwellia sp.]